MKKMIDIKLAYYRKKDWKRFMKMIDNRESMHETWDDWHKEYLRVCLTILNQL